MPFTLDSAPMPTGYIEPPAFRGHIGQRIRFYRQKIGASKLPIQMTTLPTLKAAYSNITVTESSGIVPLVEVDAPLFQRCALCSPDGGGIAVAARQKSLAVLFNGMDQH